MNDSKQKGYDERKDDIPPFSRIFVVCSKKLTEEDIRKPFEKYGIIENLYMPKDRNTGASKGVAYIKYTKTSSAAAAVEELNMQYIENSNQPVKVMVANQKNDNGSNHSENKHNRLFIMVPENENESAIKDHFSNFGRVLSFYLQKNKGKFAYVSFGSFLDAAKAYEECDRKYKAVFALPREELKRSRDNYEYNIGFSNMSDNNSLFIDNNCQDNQFSDHHHRLMPGEPQDGYKTINVTVSPQLPEVYIRRIFNILPGMASFQYSKDEYNGINRAVVTYYDHKSAACAVDKLNNFEFPSGEILFVKPDANPIVKAATDLTNIVHNLKAVLDTGTSPSKLGELADAIAHASSLLKVASSSQELQDPSFCSVKLPPLQPTATSNAEVAMRCFIVCKPQPPPLPLLHDVFCRFGDLINVITYPHKTYGFARFASTKSAQEAIKTLNGAVVCGVKIKVLEAEEKSDQSSTTTKKMKM